jgi:hypothetical protein
MDRLGDQIEHKRCHVLRVLEQDRRGHAVLLWQNIRGEHQK